jgi:polyisoprenoid-binding protein YceI
MTKRNLLIASLGGLVVLLGAVWFFFIRSDAPPPASLEEAVAAVTDGTTTTTTAAPEDAATDTTATPETSAAPTTEEGLDGSWVVDRNLSFAGYRIGEELANIGTVTAVGRTSQIDAELQFAGAAVTELVVTVDMTSLQSDRSRRDDALRTRGLETGAFPTASFVLTETVDLDAAPEEGETFTADVVGELTLHGVTNTISMPVEGSLVEGTVVVVGSVDVTLTDYGMEAPTGFSVLSINEVGTLEVQLAFGRG